jgi:hypothetical protein
MKKSTVFVSKELERVLAKDDKWRDAYRVALCFFTELVIHGSSQFDRGPWGTNLPPRHGGDGGGYIKYYCNCHCQSHDIQKDLSAANRIEAHLWTMKFPTASYLMLELRAYKQGSKEPITIHKWPFPQENPEDKIVNPNLR